MGNMVGHGRELDVSWISAEENQAFLYYSPKIWSDQMSLFCQAKHILETLCGVGKKSTLEDDPTSSIFEVSLH
jgi:hypothetical protein